MSRGLTIYFILVIQELICSYPGARHKNIYVRHHGILKLRRVNYNHYWRILGYLSKYIMENKDKDEGENTNNLKQESSSSKVGSSSSNKVGSSWLRDDCKEFMKQNLQKATSVKLRISLLRMGLSKAYGLKKRFPNKNLQFLEFGVHEGKDLIRMASFLLSLEEQHGSSYKTTLHGFDSFEGLPEDWMNGQYVDGEHTTPLYKKGAFDTGGEAPSKEKLEVLVNQGHNQNISSIDHIQFHKGWFHETLPTFLNHNTEPIAFLHADADLYTSTLTFLRMICDKKLLVKGSVIVFDEFWNYPNWQEGEYKAWHEIVRDYNLELKYEYFGYHAPTPNAKELGFYGYQSVGVLITSDMD